MAWMTSGRLHGLLPWPRLLQPRGVGRQEGRRERLHAKRKTRDRAMIVFVGIARRVRWDSIEGRNLGWQDTA